MGTHMIEEDFHFRVKLDDVPPNGLQIAPHVSPDIYPSLCARFNVDQLDDLKISLSVTRFDKAGLYVHGAMSGKVCQTCVVSLEPVWSDVNVDFEVEFQPQDVIDKLGIDPDDFEQDIPELIEEGGANIGDVAAQIFALEIPLYPRHPNAQLDDQRGLAIAEKSESPFAILRSLEKK